RVSPATHEDKVLLPARRPNYAGNGNNDLLNNSAQNPVNDFDLRQQATQFAQQPPSQRLDRSLAFNTVEHNGENWLNAPGKPGASGAEVAVTLTPMTALWMPTDAGRERLLLVRLVRIEEKEVCQGVVLDDEALRRQLADKVADLFPE